METPAEPPREKHGYTRDERLSDGIQGEANVDDTLRASAIQQYRRNSRMVEIFDYVHGKDFRAADTSEFLV